MLLVNVIFFFNDTATTEIYTLSLHDALPIWRRRFQTRPAAMNCWAYPDWATIYCGFADRKSTRLNSSHTVISYAVFCLKKKKQNRTFPRKQKSSVFRQT